MSRWIVAALIVVGCNGPLSDRQFCVKQQMAWESAFPAVSQTDVQRQRYVDDCLATIGEKHRTGAFDRSVACFDKLITGKGHATEEYLAFKRCEAAGAEPAGSR
jgi:hypothetical protein